MKKKTKTRRRKIGAPTSTSMLARLTVVTLREVDEEQLKIWLFQAYSRFNSLAETLDDFVDPPDNNYRYLCKRLGVILGFK